MQEYKGTFVVPRIKIGIVVARFNEFVTKNLLAGALEACERFEIQNNHIDVAWVPGAFELPLIAQQMAQSKKYDALICLGAVIRGSTPHFDYVCSQAAAGISKVSLEENLPVIFGVLTTDTVEQALERAGTKMGNKGFDAVATAVEMVSLINKLIK